MPKALGHMTGPVLLGLSLLLAVAMWTVPAFDRWSGGAPWTLLAGVIAFALVAVIGLMERKRELKRLEQERIAAEKKRAEEEKRKAEEEKRLGGKKKQADTVRPEVTPELVDTALRVLNKPGTLSKCELIDRMPAVLAIAIARNAGGKPVVIGPLVRATALRQVIVLAIELMNPGHGPVLTVTPAAIPYIILHEAYVQDKPHKTIMTRLKLADGAYWIHRTDAVEVLARDLEEQETTLSRQRPPAVP